MMPNQQSTIQSIRGFTIIELLVVIAIIAILAAVAIPNYSRYVLESRRVDGLDAMMGLQLDQEKWRANDTDYATLTELRGSDPIDSSDAYYSLSIANITATGYQITAAPKGAQTSDPCGSFILTVAGSAGTKTVSGTDDRCWQR